MRCCRLDRPQADPFRGPLRDSIPADAWVVPHALPELAEGEIRLWRGRLDAPQAVLRRLNEKLSPDEHRRAERFRFEHDRRRYIAGRGFLRLILAHCLGGADLELTFDYGLHGKPRLADRPEPDPLQFNVSHSEDLFLCVVARGWEMGVDVEHIRRIEDATAIAARFFPPEEQRRLQPLAGFQLGEAFLTLWTQREAQLKAVGVGLGALDDAAREPDPGAPPAEEMEPAANGWLTSFVPAPGYVAAVAARFNPPRESGE